MAEPEDCPMLKLSPDRRRLHVDKKIGLDVIIAFAGLLVTMFIYAMAQAEFKGEVKDQIVTLKESDKRLDADQKHTRDEVMQKLDKLNERQEKILILLGDPSAVRNGKMKSE